MSTGTNGNTRQWTNEEIIQALRVSGGIQAEAARLLGCHRNTVGLYLKREPEILEECLAIKETFLDEVEGKLFTAVRNGEPWAIKLVLTTQGRSRGYTQTGTLELTGPGGGPVLQEVQIEGPADRNRIAAVLTILAEAGQLDDGDGVLRLAPGPEPEVDALDSA